MARDLLDNEAITEKTRNIFLTIASLLRVMSAEKSNQLKILHGFLIYPRGENPISHIPYSRTTKETRKRRKGNGVNTLYCYWKIWHQHPETMAYHLDEQKQDLQVREPKPSKSKVSILMKYLGIKQTRAEVMKKVKAKFWPSLKTRNKHTSDAKRQIGRWKLSPDLLP